MKTVTREVAISMILQAIFANVQRNDGTGRGIDDTCKRLESGFVGYNSFSKSELENEYKSLIGDNTEPITVEYPTFKLERDITQVNRYYYSVKAATAAETSMKLDKCIKGGTAPTVHEEIGDIECYDRLTDC